MKTYITTMVSLAVLTAAAILNLRAEHMPEIKFDLGKNILETAKKSGASTYSTGNVAGFISYELVDLPHNIPAHYTRPGYEIKALPLFAFSLYADEEHHNGLAVHTASLQFSKDAGKSHDSAKTFVEALISQFQKGKWKRHIDELCPAVTGRSSFLNETGETEQIENCPLDPQYRLSNGDWIKMMRDAQNYEWIGDGVLATLNVRYSEDIRGITYSINLEFNDFSFKKRLEKANLARDLAAGDAKGWNSTMTEKNNMSALKARIAILEENAKRRGDTVIPR